jgi:hypothetical protein
VIDMTASIWKVPVYLPYLQPALTPEIVAEVENKLGVLLPHSYLALLREQNGGYVRKTFADSAILHTQIWGIGPHFPNIANRRWWEDYVRSDGGLLQEADTQPLVPFDGDGHWYLCLDYRKRGRRSEPAVTYIDLETEHEREVAESFQGFLGRLELSVDGYMLGILGGKPPDAIVNSLNLAFGVEFDNLSSWGSGYPVHRWPLGNTATKNWAWLSPNRVPRGFVRETDVRYRELAGLLPGTALRFPEYPDVEFILTCTDGVADRARAACVRASLSTRPIP